MNVSSPMKMYSFNLTVNTSSFFANFISLRNEWEEGVPLDVVTYHCKDCQQNLYMNPTGVFILSDSLEEPFSEFFQKLQAFFIEEHLTLSDSCSGERVDITENCGFPTNLIFLLQDTRIENLDNFYLEGQEFVVETVVKPMDDTSAAVLVVYKSKESQNELYFDFINDNFQNHLNVDLDIVEVLSQSAENLIIDDVTANEYRHLLPRLEGGGRGIKQHFNYVCRWCPKEKLTGQRGKFLEIRNYRDHFRRVHLSEEVPYTEFLENVNRREPKWLCPNCNNQMTFGNMVRHKAICRSNSSEEDSTSEEGDERRDNQRKNRTTEKTKKRMQRSSKQKELNTSDEESSSDTEYEKDRSEEESSDEEENSSSAKKHVSGDGDMSDENINQPRKSSSKRSNVYDFSSEEDEQSTSQITPKKSAPTHMPVNKCLPDIDEVKSSPVLRKKFKKTSEGKYEIVDEMNNNDQSKFKRPAIYKAPEVQDEFMKSDDENTDCDTETDISVNTSVSETGSWWQNIHEGLYCDHGYHGMKVFYKTDTEDFIKRVIQNWKTHEAKKCELDRKREDIENSDLSLNQFSPLRDQPILSAYTDFVQSHSTKDVLNIFSADYDENSVQKGAKATTAKNYANRIVEFFKFMAESYESFHLDWFTDYGGKIEKNLANGEKTFDIFIPTIDDISSFFKQYKHGINPAASVGLRIFALKKFLDFLIKLYEDNEQCFPGTILEKASMVNHLTEKLSKINRGMVTDGTIKKLSIASNRNHKQALIEQASMCPEKSTKNIMEGVSSYLNSDEYSNMKTMLLELSCKKTKMTTKHEYMLVTNWLLEMLICLGGNRPCALLGITIGKDYFCIIFLILTFNH